MSLARHYQWLRRVRPDGLRQLFEHLPGTLFFAKNTEGEIMCGNRHFVERCGYPTEEELIGRTDVEIFPPHMAAKYREDDLQVIRTGRPVAGTPKPSPVCLAVSVRRVAVWSPCARTS